MILRKVRYLFRISFMTEIDFFNWQFHRILFFQILLSEKIKRTGMKQCTSTSARYQGKNCNINVLKICTLFPALSL